MEILETPGETDSDDSDEEHPVDKQERSWEGGEQYNNNNSDNITTKKFMIWMNHTISPSLPPQLSLFIMNTVPIFITSFICKCCCIKFHHTSDQMNILHNVVTYYIYIYIYIYIFLLQEFMQVLPLHLTYLCIHLLDLEPSPDSNISNVDYQLSDTLYWYTVIQYKM